MKVTRSGVNALQRVTFINLILLCDKILHVCQPA